MSDIRATPSPRDPVEDLVFLYLEEREEGLVQGYEDFARRHTDTSAAVRERIQALERAGLMGGDAAADFPERLGSFRLIERLGGGGMGVVYLAEEESLGRRVALKLIRPEQIYFPQAKERFRREVEAVAKLSHPGIVQVYSFAEAGGVPFFAMELVEGASLGDVLQQFAGRSPTSLEARDLAQAVTSLSNVECAPAPMFEGSWTRAALEIARQVAVALAHAHERGVVHRDIKPSNVMITPDGRARLLDFGLAMRTGASRLTKTGAQLGSLPYMSPELVGGRVEEAGPATDVYSLGAALHESLALSLPFAGRSSAEVAQHILAGQHESLRRRNPEVSIDAETICNVAMDLDPKRRYASAAAMAADLSAVLERRPIAARRTQSWVRAQRWVQRNPAGAAAALLAALLLVGGPVGYGMMQARAAKQERVLNEDLRLANTQVLQSNVELERAKGELEVRNDDLTASLAREEHERARAARNFQSAFEAVDEMLATVGADDLREVPQFGPVRQKLLERALAFYGRLQQDDPDNPAVQREAARTERSRGDVLRSLGRSEEAMELYQQAVARAREVFAIDASHPDTRYTLASSLSELGSVHSQAGQPADARAAYDQSLPLFEELVREVPENDVYAHGLATVLINSGLIVFGTGEVEAARELFARATAVAGPLHDRHPSEVKMVLPLASSLSYTAMCDSRLGRPTESLAAQKQAWMILSKLLEGEDAPRSLRADFLETTVNYGLALMTIDAEECEKVLRAGCEEGERLVADFPEDPECCRGLMGLLTNLGIHLTNQAQWGEAEEVLGRAVIQGEQLCKLVPERIEFPFLLASAIGGRSAARLNQGELALALEDAVRSVEIMDGVRKSLPNHPTILASSAACLMQRGDVERGGGDWRKGVESIREGLALGAVRNDVSFQAFEALWHCARTAGEDAGLDAPERERIQAELTTQALDQLEIAIRDGFGDVERLNTLADYDGLRADARFQALVDDLVTSSK